MELAVLNDAFQPARMVEGHSSLVWSERYFVNGDFQRVSGDVGRTLSALPLYTTDPSTGKQKPTIVTLRDSSVPMVVEAHKIEKPSPKAPAKITTFGRSMETVLDRRTTIKDPLGGGTPIVAWTSVQNTAVDAAYDAMNKVVTLGSSNVLDKIPEIDIKAPLRPAGYSPPTSTKNFPVEPGELYAWVLQQIQSEEYGLRAVRPGDLQTSKIAIEIYKGVDRTKEIVFDARFDQFANSSYLLSQASWKNVDQVGATNDSLEVTNGNTYDGLNRRVTYLDATQYATGLAGSELTSMMSSLGTIDLAQKLETVLFSGEVSRLRGSEYGVDFGLGDIVKLTGNYGLSQFVRVAEFIRSDDQSGEKAYPTFASV